MPGHWLLNERLLHKKLDVRIQGTDKTQFYNGSYEGQGGFIIMKKLPAREDDSVKVALRYNRTQRAFQVRYLVPETTTELERFVSAQSAQLVVSSPGQRVVILGPDVEGQSDGCYAHVINSGYPLVEGLAAVVIDGPSPLAGRCRYYYQNFICRSVVLE